MSDRLGPHEHDADVAPEDADDEPAEARVQELPPAAPRPATLPPAAGRPELRADR